MKNTFKVIKLTTIMTLVFSCCFNSKFTNEEDIKEASIHVVEIFYSNIEGREWNRNHEYFSPVTLKKFRLKDFDTLCSQVSKEMGAFHTKTIQDWESVRIKSIVEEKIEIRFTYKVSYTNGYTFETIGLAKEGAEYKLIEYTVSFEQPH